MFLVPGRMGDMPQIPFAASWFAALGLRPNMSLSRARNFCVARNNVFLAVSSVVFNISPMVRSFNPW